MKFVVPFHSGSERVLKDLSQDVFKMHRNISMR